MAQRLDAATSLLIVPKAEVDCVDVQGNDAVSLGSLCLPEGCCGSLQHARTAHSSIQARRPPPLHLEGAQGQRQPACRQASRCQRWPRARVYDQVRRRFEPQASLSACGLLRDRALSPA